MNLYDELAARQLRDYDNRNPGLMFTEEVNLSLDEAYALQDSVADLRRRRGGNHIGYKVGCTSPSIRTQLGVDHPVAGHLWESERHSAGCSLRLTDFANPAIEGELAVELADDLRGDSLSDSEIESAVGCVFPVIELHNAVFRAVQPTAEELIANNALHAGFVTGKTRSEFRRLQSARIAIRIDGTVVDAYEGPDLTEGVIRSLRWLAGHLARDGGHLFAGQTILTGSLPGLVPVTTAGEIHVATSHFGDAAARFVR
ncbi:MAG: 2-keto-4-pentenoate hydratase [Planctomycetaceae bacterium]